MLINATQQEELRMAMVDGQRLYDLNIEAPASERKKANIYLGKITRIEPSLEAAFVDYGADRHGFLPLKEISSEYFSSNSGGGKTNIKDVLKEGQNIVVQVDKEERGNKGAALTTFVSLAGRFIVLKPNKARSGGVSRRITGQDRDAARETLNSIEVPDDMSVILRTAGIDRSAEELAWDLENLLTVWTAILNVVLERPAPFLIYRESDSVVRALRDYLTGEIGEILIDDEQTYKDAVEHVSTTMPNNLKKLKLYDDPVPLFTRYQIESQIESAFAHSVTLPSGGSIVIDHTEALVSIDINSARATKGGDIEATALNTNLEAADEIARQLRIRDLGGLIVIDFIDMGPSKNQRDVENRLREAVRKDRARVQIGKISRFGLLEMSRQRLRPSIGESAHMTCPRCSGFGNIRSVESLALAILRIVGEEARKERTAKVIAQLPVEVSTYLLNEKRDWVQNLEDSNDTQIVLVANPLLETPHYEVRRVRDDQTELPENMGVSYSLADAAAEPETPQAVLERKKIEVPAVGTLQPSKPAPKPEKPKSKGLLATITSLFMGEDKDEPKSRPQRKKGGQQKRRAQQSKRQGGDKRGPQRKKPQQQQAQQQQPKKKTRKTPARKKPAQQDKPSGPQQQSGADAKTEQQAEAKRPSRNRRSRGGRRRRRSGDRPDQAADTQQQGEQAAQEKPQSDTPRAEKPQGDSKPRADKPKAEAKPKTEKPKTDAKPKADKPKADEPKTDAKPKADSPIADKPRTDSKPKADSPKADEPKTDSKPKADSPKADEPKTDSKPKAEKKPGPPKARTDAERAAEKGKLDDTAKQKVVPEPAAKPKLLPWEAQSLPVEVKKTPKAEPRPDAKPEQKAAPKPEAKPTPEPKPESKPADPAQG
jgi:ribonuclease E